MLLQLQKLNDACITLENNNMVTYLPFNFILLKALPESYSTVVLTFLASGLLKDLVPFCMYHGIQKQHTVRNMPQQNGVVARVNRAIEEGVIYMLYESGMPPFFWGEAMASFIHVSNRVNHFASGSHPT
jgi:hypothetical protein